MDDHKRNDQRADLAHWGQWTLANGVINACNHELWVEPIEGAPTCPDCVVAAAQQMEGH